MAAPQIKKVAVLGSGIMGAGIAAHVAGAGIPVLLLDIVPKDLKPGESRNKLAEAGIENLLKAKPSLIYSKKDARLIQPGNFDDDMAKLKDCDWIVEVVVERLDIKQQVFAKVEPNLKPGAIVSSNTSGLSLQAMAEGRSAAFKKQFLITHFFNPVRYMKLVEIVSSPETDPAVTCAMAGFLSGPLGKGVVYAKDTPNFIANRIGVFGWFGAFRHVMQGGYKVEEVDKILGTAIGRPKSAMFRTTDLVGLDTLVHVAENTYQNCPKDEQRAVFQVPEVLKKMVEKKMLGDKTKQGFYKKTKDASGKKEILALDLNTLEYRPQEKVRFDSLGAVKNIEDPAERFKTMVNATDRAGELAWQCTRDVLVYAAHRVPEIADDIVNVDNAMRWGFNWDEGPFESWDTLGVKEVVARLQKENIPIPALVQQVLEKGGGRFYQKVDGKRTYFDLKTGKHQPVPERPGVIILSALKDRKKVVKTNSSASLLDLGDGVLGLEFHCKMNAIDDEIVKMMNEAMAEARKNWAGIVIGNDGANFSAGANLMLLWLEAQNKNWAAIEQVVKGFQDACLAMKYFEKPVVSAPFNLTLGGGAEAAFASCKIQAHAELYMGLVEVGVGLIPAGGGCKELLLRWEERLRAEYPKIPPAYAWSKAPDGGPFRKVQKAFETIAFAKVSTSAKEAVELGYLKKSDGITVARDHLLQAAKDDVLALAKDFKKQEPRQDILLPGQGGLMAIRSSIRGFLALNQITGHDAVIAEKLGYVLTGGDVAVQHLATEQHILDLEREVFLSLAGEEKSQARMQAILMTGKPLRN